MCHLHQQKPYSASGRVNQRRLTGLQRIRVVAQIVGCHTLQHSGRSILIAHVLRNWHKALDRRRDVFSVRPQDPLQATRSPDLTNFTSEPTFETTPAASCPTTKGSGT